LCRSAALTLSCHLGRFSISTLFHPEGWRPGRGRFLECAHPIRRGERGVGRMGGPLWSPAVPFCDVHPPCRHPYRATRATIKALPSSPHPARPYGFRCQFANRFEFCVRIRITLTKSPSTSVGARAAERRGVGLADMPPACRAQALRVWSPAVPFCAVHPPCRHPYRATRASLSATFIHPVIIHTGLRGRP